jgi:hypothetical protein
MRRELRERFAALSHALRLEKTNYSSGRRSRICKLMETSFLSGLAEGLMSFKRLSTTMPSWNASSLQIRCSKAKV